MAVVKPERQRTEEEPKGWSSQRDVGKRRSQRTGGGIRVKEGHPYGEHNGNKNTEKTENKTPSQHLHVGPMWVFDGLSLGQPKWDPYNFVHRLHLGPMCVSP